MIHLEDPQLRDVVPSVELIDGATAVAAIEESEFVEDPSTGRRIGARRASAAPAVERALDAADRAWGNGEGDWSGASLEVRAAALLRLAEEIDARAAAIAVLEAQDTGVPLSLTRLFADSLGDKIRATVDLAREELAPQVLPAGGRRVELHRLPWGPAALIVPWNAPAALAVTKLANAMIAGCPAVIKPSEHASASSYLLVEAAVAAELPPGALQIVHGAAAVGQALVADRRVRAVSMTGSTAGGLAIAASSIGRLPALQLELGGSNPAIVTADADVEATSEQLAKGAVKLNGQWCEAPRRVFVAESVHDNLIEALVAQLSGLRLGAALDPDTDVGPLAHRAHRDRVRAQLDELVALGGEVHAPVPIPATDGFFVSPSVVTGLPAHSVHEEIFGPVLTVHRVGTDAEALAAANALGDGLAAYVFAADPDLAFDLARRLHAGEVRIGGTNLLDLAEGSAQSFWGSSGLGGHGDRDVLLAFCGNRIIGEENHALPL